MLLQNQKWGKGKPPPKSRPTLWGPPLCGLGGVWCLLEAFCDPDSLRSLFAEMGLSWLLFLQVKRTEILKEARRQRALAYSRSW